LVDVIIQFHFGKFKKVITDYNIFRYNFKESENIIIISALIFMDGLHPKGYAGTVDHPGGCPGQNILEIKTSGH